MSLFKILYLLVCLWEREGGARGEIVSQIVGVVRKRVSDTGCDQSLPGLYHHAPIMVCCSPCYQ